MPKHIRVATDHPRFQAAPSSLDTCHRYYYGGPQVELVFRLADWWLQHRAASDARYGSAETRRAPETLSVFSRRS